MWTDKIYRILYKLICIENKYKFHYTLRVLLVVQMLLNACRRMTEDNHGSFCNQTTTKLHSAASQQPTCFFPEPSTSPPVPPPRNITDPVREVTWVIHNKCSTSWQEFYNFRTNLANLPFPQDYNWTESQKSNSLVDSWKLVRWIWNIQR